MICSWLCTQVESRDWRVALSTASKPCSQRQGLRAMAAEAAKPLPYHLAPLLLKPLATLLQQLHSSCLPLPHIPVAVAAAAVSRVCEDDNTLLEGILQRLGAVERSTLDCKEGGAYSLLRGEDSVQAVSAKIYSIQCFKYISPRRSDRVRGPCVHIDFLLSSILPLSSCNLGSEPFISASIYHPATGHGAISDGLSAHLQG